MSIARRLRKTQNVILYFIILCYVISYYIILYLYYIVLYYSYMLVILNCMVLYDII